MGSNNGNGQPNRMSRNPSVSGWTGGVSVESSGSTNGLSASNVGADSAGGGSGAVGGGSRAAVPAPRWMGKRVGRFRLVALLGQGAMGRVFRAEDTLMGRHVALKILPRTLKSVGGVRVGPEVLIREARAAAAIEHPNAVAVYEVNQAGDVCYVAMELLEGGSLRELVRAAGPMDLTRACLLCAEAAEALAAAHAAGVVHRDVKPANLMLSRNGRCKVVDFGLARLDEAGKAGEWAGGGGSPESVGTPQFIAPEILSGTPASASSDVYSLGGTLFYLLTGRPPYEARTARELLRMHVSAPVPDLRRVRPDASRGLADAVAKALAKRPADRWASMEQFARVLRVYSIPAASPESSGVIMPPPTPEYLPASPSSAPSPAAPGRPARPASPIEPPLPEAELAQPIAPPSPARTRIGRDVLAAIGRLVRPAQGLPAWAWMIASGALTTAVVVILCVAFAKTAPKDVAAGDGEPTSPAPRPSLALSTPAPTPAATVQPTASAVQTPVPPAPRLALLPHVPGPLLKFGDFDGHGDIGDVKKAGAVDFDPVHHDYTVTGDGFDVYFKSDSFHFLWRQMSGDLTIKADIHFVGTSSAKFRKAVLIVRQSLDPASPFADIVLHGEGTVVLQDRVKAHGSAEQRQANLDGSTLWLVRRGNQFFAYVSSATGEPQPVGVMFVPMNDPVYVGLGVSARDGRDHPGTKPETAIFSNVEIDSAARLTAPPSQ